jgi:hypothetical protein
LSLDLSQSCSLFHPIVMPILETVSSELRSLPQSVHITLESTPDLLDPEVDDFQRISSDQWNSDRYWIAWTEGLGAWVTPDGNEVILLVSDQADLTDLEGPLTTGLTSVIAGACLNLRGQVAIHANAVAFNGRAVAFAGYSGMGKSTLSAYCASRGAGFITDDVLIVNADGLVHPGNPRLKLYPHTGESLGLAATEETDYKIYYLPDQLGATLMTQAVPIANLYLLAESEDDRIYTEALAPSQAAFELLTHSYYAGRLLGSNPELFDAYLRLVTQASVKKLFYPRDFKKLPEVYEFLLNEAQEASIC